ncbi:DUF302 domain-containing protein [Hydrogenobaculum acidophilum]
MKKLLFGVWLLVGLSWATSPLYFKEESPSSYVKNLNKDFKLLYTFDIQKTMEAYDKNFIPYKVYIYNTKYTNALLSKNPLLGNAIPFSVLTYKEDGKTYIVVPNIYYVGLLTGTDTKSLNTLKKIQNTILKDLKFKLPKPSSYQSLPLFVNMSYNMDFKDATTFIKSSLESNDMTIPHQYKTNSVDILYSCNAKWGRYILSDFKDIGAFAPCRVVIYQKSGKTFVSYFNPKAIKYIDKSLKPSTIKALDRLNDILKSSLSGF